MPTRISPGVTRLARRSSLSSSWQELTGGNPQWLYFDSKVVPYPGAVATEPTRHLVCHHPAAWRRHLAPPERAPASQWRQAVIDTAHRCHQRIRYLDETVHLPGYKGSLRQLAVTGLGRAADVVPVQQREGERGR